jgi:hypothetical protein
MIHAPTGKPIGSVYVTKFEPTDLPVGALKKNKKPDLGDSILKDNHLSLLSPHNFF